MFAERATPEQQIIMQTIIHPDIWYEKRTKHPEHRTKMKMYVEALGI
jgi:hypothetical protein